MIELHHGDCLDVLASLPENSIDAVVTDPPYELGFMGKSWDASGVAFCPETWRAVFNVMKPGAHLIAFGAPKNYHRLACAIEDAGFEIRDSLMWVTGQGFPKSLNVSKALENECCDCKRPEGAASDLQHDMRSVPNTDISPGVADGAQSAHILFKGVSEHGSSKRGTARTKPEIARGEQPSVEGRRDAETTARELQGRDVCESAGLGEANGAGGRLHNAASSGDGADVRVSSYPAGSGQPQGSQSSKQRSKQSRIVADERGSQAWGGWPICERCGKPRVIEGLGTALKPAYEPIVLARKPLSEKTVAANVLRWGTGALNIDATRVATDDKLGGGGEKAETSGKFTNEGWRRPWMDDANALERQAAKVRANVQKAEALGRWPANLCHDGSQGVLDLFPQSNGSGAARTLNRGKRGDDGWGMQDAQGELRDAGTGSAARFFYCAKASKQDRAGSKHPTVKPINLMRWLVRMVAPPGGVVLDCFAGSGSTGTAIGLEGMRGILIEREKEYIEDIKIRLGL